MKIALACDHAGFELKEKVKKYLEGKSFEVRDLGCYSPERVDYPVFGEKAANAVVSKECEAGVLICGTGIGISLAANKVKGIRAAVCSEPVSARLAKEHNNANIIAFGARIVGKRWPTPFWMLTFPLPSRGVGTQSVLASSPTLRIKTSSNPCKTLSKRVKCLELSLSNLGGFYDFCR